MRPDAVFSEAFRNIATGTTAALVLALLLGAACTGLAVIDAQAINDLRERARRFVATGASVRTLSAKGQVDPVICDDLGGTGAIRSAGALAPTDPVTLLAAPANAVPGFRVTPGMGGVLGVRATSPTGVWISQDLATSLGTAPGGRLATSRGELVVAGTFAWPEDGRDMRLGYAVVQPVPAAARAMDECWADVWPSSPAADDLVRAATFVRPDAKDPMMIGQLNNSQGVALDTETAFLARPTRYVIPGCLAAGFVLGFAAARRRRLEYSAARHSGQRPVAQVATALLETGVWAVGGLVVAASALGLFLARSGDGSPAAFAIDVAGPAVAVLGSLLGTLAALTLVREDHLFRYFKER